MVSALAKVLARLRNDVTYPGDPGELILGRQRAPLCHRQPQDLDRDWIPVVASQGWLTITRDRRIQDHRLEVASVLEHSARMVALGSAEAGTKWAQVEVVMSRWRDIEALLEQPGPFISTATRSQLAEVDLETLRRH